MCLNLRNICLLGPGCPQTMLFQTMLHIDLAIGLDTDEELREGALQVLRSIRPSWPVDNIREGKSQSADVCRHILFVGLLATCTSF
jgi:hypothetical protein